jgi:hypothetical protein
MRNLYVERPNAGTGRERRGNSACRDRHHVCPAAGMLFFELLPAFLMLVALVAGVWLFVVDRQSR